MEKFHKKNLLKRLIKKIIKNSYAQDTNAVVTSVNEDGVPQSRNLFTYFENNEIFFITRSDASIVEHIKKNPNLSFSYYNEVANIKHKNINITPEYKNTNLQMEYLQINLTGKAHSESTKESFFDTKINFDVEQIEISIFANLNNGVVQDFIEYKSLENKITKRRIKYGFNKSRDISEKIDKQNSWKRMPVRALAVAV
tara:strand:+ start:118 stop:711 length:594 start_codon:yes stop_codon:yes gene_type:complete